MTSEMIGTSSARGSMFIHPHAEEVELRNGATVAPIYSTTGRHNRIIECSKSEAINEDISTSVTHSTTTATTSTSGSRQQQRRRSAPAATAQTRSSSSAGQQQPYQCYDMFGFCVTAEEKAAEDLERHQEDPGDRLAAQWDRAVQHWQSVDHEKLKRMCRRGIPQSKRRVVWQRLLESWGVRERYPGLYHRLRSQKLASKDVAGVIERDLDRTFPTNRLFAEGVNGPGQQMLRNILRAYANYNTKVGYCQGMGFLAATLILQIEEEEDAFWAFVAVMEHKKFSMSAVFSPGFPQLQCMFYVFESLMKKKMPALYRHMHDTYQIHPSFYSTHWFMTVFTYYFNFGLVSRIWDMFLCEGWKPVYRIALALMKLEEKHLLRMHSETELLLALKVIQEAKKPAELLKTAARMKFKSAYVHRLVAEHYSLVKGN